MSSRNSESETVIRRLYEITNHYDKGFEYQITELLKMGLERFGLDIGILARVEDGNYHVEYCVCPPDVPLKPGDNFALGHTYCSVTCDAHKPVAIEHVGKSDLLGAHPAYRQFGLESYIGVPIFCDGVICGTLNFSSPSSRERKFKETDIEAIQLAAFWVQSEWLRRRQEEELADLNRQLLRLNEQLTELARTDPLTELPNRRYMFEHLYQGLNQLIRRNGEGVLIVADLDNLKNINDMLGHQEGDRALVLVADALRRAVRNYDFVSRYGGDEFLIWLPDTPASEIKVVCERIKSLIEKVAMNTGLKLTLSMGVCSFTCDSHYWDDHSNILEKLISYADMSLYKAKGNGRNCYMLSSGSPVATSELITRATT